MLSYQYRNSHYEYKMVSWLSYLYNGNPHTWNDHLYIVSFPVTELGWFVTWSCLYACMCRMRQEQCHLQNMAIFWNQCNSQPSVTRATHTRNISSEVIWTERTITITMGCDKYRQTFNISRTLVDNKIVEYWDVDGASPVGAAPTTSSFST